MSFVEKNKDKITSLRAPLLVASVGCDSCPIGCSSDYHPVEICPLIPRDYPTGAPLATRGDPANYVWFVKSGAVAGSWGRGRETDVLFSPGSVVGLEGLVVDTHLLTVWTLARTTLCSFDRQSFATWLERRGDLANDLTKAAHEMVAAATQPRQSST